MHVSIHDLISLFYIDIALYISFIINLHILQFADITNSEGKMIIIKAAKRIQQSIVQNSKEWEFLQKDLLLNFILLTALKNYLYRCITEQKILINVPEEIRRIKDKDRIVLVLDMDETLVHTRKTVRPSHTNFILKNGQFIQTRPHLKQFMQAASQVFRLYVYTAGDRDYADQVLDAVDTEGLIEKRFYRQHCRKSKVHGYLKDLKLIKKVAMEKRQMILLDDNVESTNRNYPFSVNIKPFQGDQQDRQLVDKFKTLLKFYQFSQ